MQGWRKLSSFPDVAQAGLFKSLLEQHGIESRYKNFYSSGVIGHLPFVEVYPEVWVRDDQGAQGLQVLEEFNRPIDQTAVDWLCSVCGESNPGSFEICWQCQAARNA